MSPPCLAQCAVSQCVIVVAPTLVRHPADGQLVVKKGSTVQLKCQAEGFPTPQVTTHGMTVIPRVIELMEEPRGVQWESEGQKVH